MQKYKFYAFAVRSPKGHFCIGADLDVALFRRQGDAIRFRDALTERIGRGSVIRVKVKVIKVKP